VGREVIWQTEICHYTTARVLMPSVL